MKPHELLTMLERAQVIKEAIARGIRSLDLIWAEYDQYVLMDNQQQYPLEQYEMLQLEPQQIPLELIPIEEIPEETPTPPQPIDLKELTRLRALEMFSNNTPLNFTTEKLNNSPLLYEAPSTPLQELLYTDTPLLTNLFDDGGNLKEEVYDAGTLPTAVVETNYPSEEDIKSNIESLWASAKNLPFYNITKDNTFTREKTGAGSIEYFNEPAITYNNGVTVNNPNSNPTILFDPNTNTVEDIKLDLLHHYREYDPVYKDKLNRYQNALLSNPNTASDVLWNSLLGLLFIENYAEKDELGNLLRDNNGNFIIKDEYWPIWDKLVDDNLNNDSFIILGVDGSLRNLLTSDLHAKTNNYAPIEEARKLWLRDKEANIAFEDLKDYIIDGKKALGGNLYPEGGAVYTVQQGDVLGSIAKRHNTTVNEILAVNKGMNPDKLSLGQKINIPRPKPEEPKRDFKTNGPINNQLIALRLMYLESTYDPNAYNKGSLGAGLFLITPIVLKEYNEMNKTNLQLKDLYDPTINTKVRNWYINTRLPLFLTMKGLMGDSIRMARQLASYNWGASYVNNAIQKAKEAGINVTDGWKWLDYLPAETRNYVNFILRNKDLQVKTDKDMLSLYAKFVKLYPNYKFKANGGNLLYDGGNENNPGEESYWGNENFGYLPTTTVTAKAPTRWDEFSKDFRQFFTGKDKSNYVWDLNAGRYRYEKVADNPLDLFRYSEKRRARELRYLDRYNRLKEIIEENPLTYGVAEKPFWGLPYSTAESVYAGLQYLTGNKAAGDAIWDHINNEVAPQQIAPLAITIGTMGLGEGINAVAGPTAANIFNTSVLGLFGSLQAKDLEEKTNGFTTTDNLTPEDYVNTALMLGLPSAKYLEGMSGELILSLMLKGVNLARKGINRTHTASQPSTFYTDYVKAVLEGDVETALALRSLHFVDSASNSVLIDNGNPMDLYHSTNNLFTVPSTTNNPKGSSSSFGPGFYTAPAENLAKLNNIMMRLYGNMENPNIIWTAEDWLKAANDFSFGDGVMARKTNRVPLPETFTDIVFREPNQVKLADPVTYFKANDPEVLSGLFKEGDVIPLWMRDDFSRNDIRFTINPYGISLAPLSADQISKGLSERQNFINWLQDNPEVSFIGGKGTSPDAAQNSWKKGAAWIDEVNINPNGRIGSYLLYLLNRFGLKPLKKIGLGSSNNFEENVGGWYNPVTNQACVSVDNIEDFIPKVVHEIGGHSTEGEVMSKSLLDFTEKEPPKITGFNGMKDFLKSSPTEIFGREIKTIEDVYSKLANIKRSLTTLPKFYKNNKRFTMPLHSQDSRLAVEARATFKLLLEQKLNEFGYDLQKYNEYIDNMTLEDIMSWLQEANGYGVDYRNNLKYASNKDKKLWLNLAKYALKYLPSTAPIVIGLSTASTDNQQALGGHLQNKQQTNLFLL